MSLCLWPRPPDDDEPDEDDEEDEPELDSLELGERRVRLGEGERLDDDCRRRFRPPSPTGSSWSLLLDEESFSTDCLEQMLEDGGGGGGGGCRRDLTSEAETSMPAPEPETVPESPMEAPGLLLLPPPVRRLPSWYFLTSSRHSS